MAPVQRPAMKDKYGGPEDGDEVRLTVVVAISEHIVQTVSVTMFVAQKNPKLSF